ncbi:single-stranded nucleic acid binding R3H domain-containing protein [Thalassoporum mexicanum PCC 7367]|uniref:Jag family protein n=1 Tax=Thalassoporum mexicanum TaxID=3457544 RepID=UPI00029FDF9C|nr:R3H domain-containing nucleic acid-binding protein [Pseudanabaena sp. PCC 7367]AFY71673.1 single-stranded nucleic acid binding R3H domain-containing protein [Pseudanabaena sp. PCC 7367]
MPPTERGKEWLASLLDLLGLETSIAATIESAEVDPDRGDSSCRLTVDHNNLSEAQVETFIGRGGVNIDAIQYLANVSLNASLAETEQSSYVIDINGYRQEREQRLQQIAIAAAEKVRSTSQPEQIDDLSAAERKVLHNLLKEYPDLKTESRGREPHRHLIVSLQTAAEVEEIE